MCRETNLKVKQCLDVTNALGEDEKSLSQFSGHILCEPPNNNLGKLHTISFYLVGSVYQIFILCFFTPNHALKNALNIEIFTSLQHTERFNDHTGCNLHQ